MKQLELSPTICWNQKNGTTTLDDSLAGFFFPLNDATIYPSNFTPDYPKG